MESSQHYQVGTVIAYTEDNLHIVEAAYGNCFKAKFDDLVTEATAKQLRKVLDAKQLKLEAEFLAVRKQIEEKLDKAAALIQESNDLASDHHKNLTQLYPETTSLENVLMDVGWISSNSNC